MKNVTIPQCLFTPGFFILEVGGGERNGGSVAPLLTKGCNCKATNKSDSFADLRVSKKNITCCSCGSSRCQQ